MNSATKYSGPHKKYDHEHTTWFKKINLRTKSLIMNIQLGARKSTSEKISKNVDVFLLGSVFVVVKFVKE